MEEIWRPLETFWYGEKETTTRRLGLIVRSLAVCKFDCFLKLKLKLLEESLSKEQHSLREKIDRKLFVVRLGIQNPEFESNEFLND